MSIGTDAVDRFIQPRRRVSIRRDDNDFVIVFQPEDLVAFRNASATSLRKVCHFLRWEVVNDTVPEAGDPGSW
jgi:tRNA threonylcarbamoyladenosine modification (KEOPS) complex  Pcc1 subunit